MLVDGVDRDFWGWPSYGNTTFHVACSEDDYEDCMDLVRACGWPDGYRLQHPTIMAIRDGDLVGMIGTRLVGDCPLAGPLALLPGVKRPVLAFRLLVQYEAALRSMGISEIVFDVDIGSAMERAVLKAQPHMKPFLTEQGRNHYVWQFAERQEAHAA